MRTILIPAAGSASRMRGADKLLEPVEGVPVLARLAAAAVAAGARVLVTLPDEASAFALGRRRALAGRAVEILPVAAAEGMAASIRAGAAATGGALMVLPADMPEIGAAEIGAVWAAAERAPDRIWRGAGADGTPGHPVIFPPSLRAELAALSGDTGGRAIIDRHGAGLVRLPGRAAILDLDTPEAWAAWRRDRR